MTPTQNPYAAVADSLQSARALPGPAYVDPAVFAEERQRVFAAGWLPVARVSDLAAPGDYRSADLAGTPVVATRDKAGDLHVLSRACRHRGMPVVQGAGNAASLNCPYHLWRYGLDGRLLSAPAMDQSTAFDVEACALPAVRHEVWGGWLFANLDGAALPLAEALAPLAERLAPLNPDRLVTAGVLTYESPWNWKVMVENFLESYHHIGPHAASLQQTNPGLSTRATSDSDRFSILENPGASDDIGSFVVAVAFPATLMFFTEGVAPFGVWYELCDIGPTRFTLNIHMLAPPELAAVPEIVAEFRDQVAAVHGEDIPVCEGVQRGVSGDLYTPGPLSHLEAGLWAFHRHLAACFNSGSST
ncbi:MAG: aromatic ring-hydroxylating dioxygenase subunit alpha [Caulobacter sp.]|nr:aromatic ring-hydroxylating dioxygenase subunit alpha [Caulobacter sp.]